MSPIRNSLRDLLFVLFKQKKLIIYIIISVLLVTLIYSILKTPMYNANAKVYIKSVVYEEALYDSREIRSTDISIGQDRLNTEIEIIKSQPVAEKVVALYNLQNYEIDTPTFRDHIKSVLYWPMNQIRSLIRYIFSSKDKATESTADGEGKQFQKTVNSLRSKINASPVPFSRVIQISYQHRDPKLATDIVNSVMDEYLQRHLAVNISQGKSAFYKEQMNAIAQKLDLMEEQFTKFKSEEEIISYDDQEKSILRTISSYENALTEVSKEIISQQNKLDKLQNYIRQNPNKLIPSKEIAEKPLISRLYSELIALQLRLSELLQKYTDESRVVIETKSQISEYEIQIREQVNKEIELESASLDKLLAEESALESTIARLRASLLSLPKKEITYKTMENNIEEERSLLKSLREKYEEALVEEARDNRSSTVNALEYATVPIRPSTPKIRLNLIIALIFSLLVGLTVAFGFEFFDHTINTPEDSEHYLNLKVLGSIEEA